MVLSYRWTLVHYHTHSIATYEITYQITLVQHLVQMSFGNHFIGERREHELHTLKAVLKMVRLLFRESM